jgi:hypothetical protein
MYNCPKCGRLLNFDIVYTAGTPIIIYKCDCGYNSASYKYSTTTDNKTYVNMCEIDSYVTNHSIEVKENLK